MTDNEIIKALECCMDGRDCAECPAQGVCMHDYDCPKSIALDLINCQKAEVERLKGEMKNISAKTLKRFEKNLKNVKVTLGQTWEIQNALKETLKEMVSDNNGNTEN